MGEEDDWVLIERSVRPAVGSPSAEINGQHLAVLLGRQAAQAGWGGKRHGGPFRRPGRWLLGLGPRGGGRAASGPILCTGRMHSTEIEIVFQKLFLQMNFT